MEQFSNKLTTIETKLRTLAKKLLQLKHDNETLQNENLALKEAHKEVEGLQAKISTLMQANESFGLMKQENAKLKVHKEQSKLMVAEIKRLQKIQLSFDNTVEQEKRKMKALQNTNQQLLTENSKLRNVQKQSPNIALAAEGKVQELEIENNRLKKQIEKDKRRVADLQEQLSQNFNSPTGLPKTSPDKTRIKKEIDLYITEIDKCIELIKE